METVWRVAHFGVMPVRKVPEASRFLHCNTPHALQHKALAAGGVSGTRTANDRTQTIALKFEVPVTHRQELPQREGGAGQVATHRTNM
jgi:hypothetical protein